MPNLRPQTSSGPLPAEQDDAFSRLTKMSTTAGVGSGDYVAINTLAIASVILGFFSVFVPLLGYALLQIIPLAAVVTALMAWSESSAATAPRKEKAWRPRASPWRCSSAEARSLPTL